jgi:hypothetical protein
MRAASANRQRAPWRRAPRAAPRSGHARTRADRLERQHLIDDELRVRSRRSASSGVKSKSICYDRTIEETCDATGFQRRTLTPSAFLRRAARRLSRSRRRHQGDVRFTYGEFLERALKLPAR